MNIGMKLAILALAMAAVAESVMNYQQSGRHHGPQRPGQIRVHRSGPPGHLMRYRNPVKRVYVPLKYMPHHNAPIPHRQQHLHKVRYGPPAQSKRSPASPPPGWKPKRMGPPPPSNYGPPRKTRTPKPPKYQKPYNKGIPNKYDSYGKPVNSPQVQTDSYGAPKPQSYKVPSTTYGIPHPTQGSPEPPKNEDVATSYVQVYQGDRELEAKTSYSFTNTHAYPEKHKGKVYDDLTNHRPVYNHSLTTSTTDQQSKKGFQPPKQTFGFQPYEDTEEFPLTPSQGYYTQSSSQQTNQQPSSHSTSTQHKTEEFLSPSYFDQKS